MIESKRCSCISVDRRVVSTSLSLLSLLGISKDFIRNEFIGVVVVFCRAEP